MTSAVVAVPMIHDRLKVYILHPGTCSRTAGPPPSRMRVFQLLLHGIHALACLLGFTCIRARNDPTTDGTTSRFSQRAHTRKAISNV